MNSIHTYKLKNYLLISSDTIVSISSHDSACGFSSILFWLKYYYPELLLSYTDARKIIADIIFVHKGEKIFNYFKDKNLFKPNQKLDEITIIHILKLFNIDTIILDIQQNIITTSLNIFPFQKSITPSLYKNIAIIINRNGNHWEPLLSNKNIEIDNL